MHYIVYHDKSFNPVDDKTAQILWDKSCEGLKGVEINGTKYNFSSISKILLEEDYYIQYPHRRPPDNLKQLDDIYGDKGCDLIRKPTEKAKEQMKEGFFQYQHERGLATEDAQKKWEEIMRAGIDYRINKLAKYRDYD